jgi:glycosyltransferase involved in cell wall biosynthesis
MIKVLQLRCSGALLGAESVALELSSDISKKYDYESVLGVIHDSRDPYPELVIVAKSRGLNCQVFEASSKFDWHCISSIRKYVKENEIDIIHSHGYREDIYSFLCFSGSTKIATNHLWKKSNFMLKLYAFIDSLCMISFCHVIAVSEPILNEMKNIPYLRDDRLSLIPNGIDTIRFSPDNVSTIRHELKLDKSTVLLSTVSSLTTEKGHKYLLTALSRLKTIHSNFHLAIIGDGAKRDEIEAQIKELELTAHVTLLGRRSDIDRIHPDVDIYLLPSLKEGLPMSLLEAMACGTAAIASDVGDVAGCLIHKRTGLLIKPANPDDIYKSLCLLISDEDRRKQLGRSAANIIQQQFSNEKMVGGHAEIYKNSLGK